MIRKFVKMPIPGRAVKNDNCLFYSGEILCGEPYAKVHIWNILSMEGYYKDINFITFLKLFRTEKSVKKQSSCEILQKTFANDLIYSLSLFLRLSYNCLSKV